MVEKLVEAPGFPDCGAEDLIVGELAGRLGGRLKSTGRLYMSNVHYPYKDNDMVTAHWCTPAILRALHTFNHKVPSVVCDVEHLHWKGEMLFYSNGVFRRRDTFLLWLVECWTEKEELTLKWQMWPMEQLLLEGDSYIGSEMKFTSAQACLLCTGCGLKAPSASSAEIMDQSPLLYIHLGCGNRRLNGWLNLDSPTMTLPVRFHGRIAR